MLQSAPPHLRHFIVHLENTMWCTSTPKDRRSLHGCRRCLGKELLLPSMALIVRENFRKERNDWKLDLRVGDGANAIELEIFAEPNPPKRVSRPEACGLRHLAFRVDDVEATVEELAQMGIECEPIRLDSYTKKKMTFFFDPDGLPLELHE